MAEELEWVANHATTGPAPRMCREGYGRMEWETQEQADRRTRAWAAQFVEGPPRADGTGHTVEELRAMGLVGLYRRKVDG